MVRRNLLQCQCQLKVYILQFTMERSRIFTQSQPQTDLSGEFPEMTIQQNNIIGTSLVLGFLYY